jgi:hypothetical protein
MYTTRRTSRRPGDLVEIMECPPRSKTKRWELVRVVAKSTAVDLAALRSGARATEMREASVRDEEAKATGQASETTAGGAGDEEGVDDDSDAVAAHSR